MARHYKTHYIPIMDEKMVVQLLLHKSDLGRLAEILDPDDAHTMLMDLEKDLQMVMQALDSLPDKKRVRVEMYLFSGKTQAQQAEFFHTSQPNVKRDFLRAIKSLVRIMSPKVESPNSTYARKVQEGLEKKTSKKPPGQDS
jgi:RNA polymerase sigma factor (sigma-70 family)